MKKGCAFLNYAPHYRLNIFNKLALEFDIDFYFEETKNSTILKLDYTELINYRKELRTWNIKGIKYTPESLCLMFKPYKYYLLTGDPHALSAWMILLLSKVFGKKVYLWTHGWYGDEKWEKVILKKMFLGLADGVFLYGDYAKQLMLKKGFLEKKLHVIYNSLDYALQLKYRKTLNHNDIYSSHFINDLPVVIFTGRLSSSKRLDLLILAHQKMILCGFPVNIIILGIGPEYENLQNMVKTFGFENYYWFYGDCYDEAIISNLYYNATVCVSPGNVGLTAIHALGYGCPVISHSDFKNQMPEFESIIQGQTGDFFESNNVDSLANMIIQWIKSNHPKSQRLIESCFCRIDSYYSPDYQINILKKNLI